MPYQLLAGRAGAGATRSLGTPVIVAMLALAGVIAALYATTRPSASREVPAPVVSVATPTAIPAPVSATPDLSFHVARMTTELATATEQLAHAQRLVGGLVPDLTRDGLWMERRRAEAAVASCETAKQAVERALAELHVAVPEKE
jgi:hypothetical protein